MTTEISYRFATVALTALVVVSLWTPTVSMPTQPVIAHASASVVAQG